MGKFYKLYFIIWWYTTCLVTMYYWKFQDALFEFIKTNVYFYHVLIKYIFVFYDLIKSWCFNKLWNFISLLTLCIFFVSFFVHLPNIIVSTLIQIKVLTTYVLSRITCPVRKFTRSCHITRTISFGYWVKWSIGYSMYLCVFYFKFVIFFYFLYLS